MIVRRVGPKGQIVIPKDMRQMLEIEPGEDVVLEVRNNTILIKPKKESITKHLSSLVPKGEKRVIRKIDLDKYYEEELAERQRSKIRKFISTQASSFSLLSLKRVKSKNP